MDIDAMAADLQDKIKRASLALQKTVNTQMNAAPVFKSYHHAGINFQITTLHEEQLLNQILNMDYEGVTAAMEEVNLANSLDYPCIREHWHSVKIRAIALRVHQLQKLGKLQPRMTWGEFLQGWMRGGIIYDEYDRRFGGYPK